jgi:HSP20 family protein
MNSPFRKLDQLQSDLGEIAVYFTHIQFDQFGAAQKWKPAINAFRCGEVFMVCVELAGVDKDGIEVSAEQRRLTIRGTRQAPEPSCNEPTMQVFALEIDHGPFERILDLPADVETARVTAEHRNGLLWIRLPLRTAG